MLLLACYCNQNYFARSFFQWLALAFLALAATTADVTAHFFYKLERTNTSWYAL